jgi:pantetheine-phosphate adenylyltransferase
MAIRIGIYPGTFDPITIGHMDIVIKALNVVDQLIIGVATHHTKVSLFSVDERIALIEKEVSKLEGNSVNRIKVDAIPHLLVDFAQKHQAKLIIRGLRAVSDFEYEFNMACVNSKLQPAVQTIFIPASDQTHFISSSLIKEVVRLNNDKLYSHNLSSLVSGEVLHAMRTKLGT